LYDVGVEDGNGNVDEDQQGRQKEREREREMEGPAELNGFLLCYGTCSSPNILL